MPARERAADRDSQRQRHVDRAAGRRHVGLSGAADLGPHLSVAARDRQAVGPASAEIARTRDQRADEYARTFVTGGTLFEELGFFYVGPIDGHNLDHLLPVLKNVRDAENGPILVHVVTQKGKGYAPAEASDDKYHGVVKFDVATGKQAKAKATRRPTPRCSAKAWSRRRGRTTASSRLPRRCRRAPASTFSARRSRSAPSTSALPSSMR